MIFHYISSVSKAKGGSYSLGIRDLFQRDTLNVQDYVDVDEYAKEDLQKSFRTGKSNNRGKVDALDINQSNNYGGPFSAVNKNDVLQKKKILNQYASNVIVQAIIRTRTNQVTPYCIPARLSRDGIGYEVVPKEIKGDKVTNKQKERSKELEDFIYHTGKDDNKEWRDTLPAFVTKIINDILVQDQVNIERVYESPNSAQLNHFNAVDASTIVISKLPASLDQPRSFEQIIDTKKIASFNEKEMVFETYWPTTTVNNRGYGYGPLEVVLPQLSYETNTEQFNARFFSQGGTTRGILVLNPNGDAQQQQMAIAGIRRQWNSQGAGMNGAWKVPMISGQDAKFVNMTQTSKDMEFEKFLNYLIYVIAAVYQIQPEEINFPNRGGATGRGGGNSVNEGNTMQSKISSSQSKGLQPLLFFIERLINEKILSRVDSDYQFKFTLGGTQSELEKQQVIEKELSNGMLLNEARVKNGLAKLDGLDVPGNVAQAVQWKQSEMNQSDLQHSKDYNKAPTDPKSPLPVGDNQPNNQEDSQSDPDNQPNNNKPTQ